MRIRSKLRFLMLYFEMFGSLLYTEMCLHESLSISYQIINPVIFIPLRIQIYIYKSRTIWGNIKAYFNELHTILLQKVENKKINTHEKAENHTKILAILGAIA